MKKLEYTKEEVKAHAREENSFVNIMYNKLMDEK